MSNKFPFFGRETELQLLHNAWSVATITRKPQIVTLVGDIIPFTRDFSYNKTHNEFLIWNFSQFFQRTKLIT